MIIGAQPLTHRPARKGRKEGPDGTSYHYIIFQKDSTDGLQGTYNLLSRNSLTLSSVSSLGVLPRLIPTNYYYCWWEPGARSPQSILISWSYYHSLSTAGLTLFQWSSGMILSRISIYWLQLLPALDSQPNINITFGTDHMEINVNADNKVNVLVGMIPLRQP